MQKLLSFLTVGLTLVLGSTLAQAAQVTIKGVHLCCGACVRDASAALEGLKGISNVAIDRNSKQITFEAADEASAQEAVNSLAENGFAGTAAMGDKALPLPETGAKKGAIADQVVFGGVHLCCGACVTGAQKSVENVDGVQTIDIDRKAGTVTLKGEKISEEEAAAALIKGGFFGSVEK